MRKRNDAQRLIKTDQPTQPVPSKKAVETDEKPKDDPTNDNLSTWGKDDFDLMIFLILCVLRVVAPFWSVINDCDEVYNYWEPLHLFLYGDGFQTWEYSPAYAIRSYFYICLHYIPAWFLSYFSKTVVFYGVRLLLSFICFFGEMYAYRAVRNKISVRSGRFFIVFSAFSSGVFLSCCSFLPSSFCMTLTFFAIGAFLNEEWSFGIFCVAFSSLVGWPFSAVLGLPFLVHMLVLKDLKAEFILSALFSGLGIATVQFLVDSYFFGKPVVASLNIVLYNVLGGPGPELYGTASIVYYIKNLFLNWNILFFVFVGAPLIGLWRVYDNRATESLKTSFENNSTIYLFAATTFLWVLIFGSQAHKEERFLFPIYPFIALVCAITYDSIQEHFLRPKARTWSRVISRLFLLCYMILFVSRGLSMLINYESHIGIYRELKKEVNPTMEIFPETKPYEVQICVGKEWHRFPSSFFVPPTDKQGRKVNMAFVRSEFRGILPKPFKRVLHLIDSTRNIPRAMNDRNKEELSRYVSLDTCNYFIDLDMPPTEMEPNLQNMTDVWEIVAQGRFVDSSKEARFFGILRSFYVPFLSDYENMVTYYTLYRNKKLAKDL